MATQEQIEFVLRHMPASQPKNFLREMNEGYAGLGAVLKTLSEAKQPVSAGFLGEKTGVSSARMTVLLHKLEKRNMIERSFDSTDARVVLVALSEEGKRHTARMKEQLCRHIALVIDRIGIEDMKLFIELSDRIRAVMDEVHPLPDGKE